MQKIKSAVTLSCITLLLSACSSSHSNLSNVDTTNYSQLERIKVEPVTEASNKTELNAMRAKSIKDTALSLGAQGGLAWASERINAKTNLDHKYLDTIFNFNAMMLSHGVLPPVLEEGDFSLNLADPNTIRVADRTYKIVQQARFATTAPNWREYIALSYSKPEMPDKTLLPKTEQEQKVWREGLRAGWQMGIDQAYSIFQQNLARLKRDYSGMVLYRKLLDEKMISPPFVATTELGVTGDGSDMRVNDQVLRIVELPKLQTNSRGWNAIVVKKDS